MSESWIAAGLLALLGQVIFWVLSHKYKAYWETISAFRHVKILTFKEYNLTDKILYVFACTIQLPLIFKLLLTALLTV